MSNIQKKALEALLRPEDSIVEPTMIINNVASLTKASKIFKVPTILTTVIEEQQKNT
jgi:nicotinamidase-related amidase